MILGFQSVQELWAVRAKLNLDKELDKAYQEWQTGPEAPFEQQANAMLESTDYSPEMVALDPPPSKPRIFELRVYHSPNYRSLKSLHERFAGPESKLFHKSGVHPILYSSTVIGPNMPNLTYVTPFDDLASQGKGLGCVWLGSGVAESATGLGGEERPDCILQSDPAISRDCLFTHSVGGRHPEGSSLAMSL